VRCTYDSETRGGNAPDNRKVRGTIHWVSAAHSVPLEVRLYGYLFSAERPMEVAPRHDGSQGSFLDNLNPHSLTVIPEAWGEAFLAGAKEGARFQFERLGYFVRDKDNTETRPVFNRTIGLRDTWAKIEKKAAIL
jgi:glutaminyl-tRNA synthetase